MMISYSGLSKLRTKQAKFEDVFLACNSATLEQLKDGSSKRRGIEESINKNSSITDAIAREMSGGLTSRYEQDIQKLEQYLPIVENLVRHVELVSDSMKMNGWIAELKIRWSSVLSSSSLFSCKGSKFYQINDLRFELGMILFLYGAFLRERALELLSTDLVQSASFFRKAAGVYHYLANEVLPPLQPFLPQERPSEASSCVSSIMSLICLAEAQAVTARKAEEKGNSEGLLAKLQRGVREFLDEAIGILHSSNKERKDITSRFEDFISSCQKIHELKSFRYLAESLKNDGKIGSAIGVLRLGLVNAQKNMPKEESWRSACKQVIEEMTGLLRKYEHENEFVWHEKIPSQYDLPVPQGVKIVNLIPYHPQRSETPLVFKL